MLTWPLKALFFGTVILIFGAVVFVVRPTPVLGVDGASLGRSVDGFLATGSCKRLRADGRWECFKTDAGGSGGSTYLVEVDWLGCWDGRRRGRPALEGGTPLRISGCVTLLSHLGD